MCNGQSNESGHGRHEEVSRRAFLRVTAGTAALGAMGSVAWGETAQSKPAAVKPILPFGKLGKTGHPVTLVSFGGILLKGAVGTRVLQLAIDRGINLAHTSASYGNGASLEAFGQLFKAAPAYRDKIFLALKSYTPEKESEIDDMLKTLSTDHVEAVLTELHDPDPKRVDAIQKQQDALKKKGKVRYTGFVCHGQINDVLEMVVDKHARYFDMALLAMKLVPKMVEDKSKTDEAGKRFLKNVQAMRKAGIGILSMKSGAKQAVGKGEKVYLPHLKAYLEAGADSVLTSMDTLDQVDMTSKLKLDSPHLSEEERKAALDFHDSLAGTCRMCGECKKVCPLRLPVNDLMRFRMYHDEYGLRDHARAEYAALKMNVRAVAAGCGDCEACGQVCPVKLASSGMVRRVADLLA